MFTLLFHLLPLMGLAVGLAMGLTWGITRFGWLPGLACGLAGAFVGFMLARLPGAILLARAIHALKRRSTPDLRDELYTDRLATVNLILGELRARGEDTPEDRAFVLDLMASDDYNDRCRGWAALMTAYPEEAERIPGYSPVLATEDRDALLAPLLDGGNEKGDSA
jgi:hypothetical protein